MVSEVAEVKEDTDEERDVRMMGRLWTLECVEAA